jgi:hypothetical protein
LVRVAGRDTVLETVREAPEEVAFAMTRASLPIPCRNREFAHATRCHACTCVKP